MDAAEAGTQSIAAVAQAQDALLMSYERLQAVIECRLESRLLDVNCSIISAAGAIVARLWKASHQAMWLLDGEWLTTGMIECNQRLLDID